MAERTAEEILYSAGISIYRLGIKIAGLWNEKARLLSHGHGEIFDRLSGWRQPGDRVVWVHAASLGEFEQGRPLMERIRREHPQVKILLTFFSPSGYEVRKNWQGADCVCYLPFDTPGRVKRFLDLVEPEMAIFVKYEIWRNYLCQLHRRNIPTYLISAIFRDDQYCIRHPRSPYREWLGWFSRIFVQDENSRRLLAGIGVDRVEVCGDTRFDRVSTIRATRRDVTELQAFTRHGEEGASPVMMVGSSWEADENVYAPWFDSHPEVKLVIAPHEFNEVRLNALRRRFRGGVVMLSELQSGKRGVDGAQVLVIDCFGLLSSAYYYCDVAYVGGAFGAGLHNINEAAVYGVPVVYGPNNRKFIEAQEMKACGGGIEIKSRQDFEEIADRLLGSNEASRRERKERGAAAEAYIQSKLGATDKIYEELGIRR